MRSLLVLFLMTIGATASANDWYYKDGYWWRGGQAYTVSRVYVNGCWKWQYNLVPSYQDAKWRDKLTEIVATQEKYDAAMKLSALEHAEWLESIKAIGYPKQQNYSLRYATGYAPQAVVQQGDSVYGSVTESYNFYNPTNLDVQWNQADRHVEKAQSLAGEAANGFRELLKEASSQEASAKERIAAIYAKAELLKAADTPEITIKKTTVTQKDTSGKQFDVLAVIEGKCISCHNAQNPQGMLDLSKYETFSSEKKDSIRKKITDPDPNKRMPLKKQGDDYVPGEPLTFEELVSFSR